MRWIAPTEKDTAGEELEKQLQPMLHQLNANLPLGIRGEKYYNDHVLPPRPICRKARAGLSFLGA